MATEPRSQEQLRFSPKYQVGPEAQQWLSDISQQIALDGIRVATARQLVVNNNALIMPDATRTQALDVLANHYAQDGLLPVDDVSHHAIEDICAAVTCEQFGVSVSEATAEYGSEDAWVALVEPYKQYSFSKPRVFFSTFVEACRRIPIIDEIRRQLVELERIESDTYEGPNPRAADTHKIQTIHAMKTRIRAMSQHLYVTGLPSQQEDEAKLTLLEEVFGATDTAQAFRANTAIKLPDLGNANQLGVSERNLTDMYSPDRILSPKQFE